MRFLTGRFIWEYCGEERLYVHQCDIGGGDDNEGGGGSGVLLEILDTDAKVDPQFGRRKIRDNLSLGRMNFERAMHLLTHLRLMADWRTTLLQIACRVFVTSKTKDMLLRQEIHCCNE